MTTPGIDELLWQMRGSPEGERPPKVEIPPPVRGPVTLDEVSDLISCIIEDRDCFGDELIGLIIDDMTERLPADDVPAFIEYVRGLLTELRKSSVDAIDEKILFSDSILKHCESALRIA
jgi:hypothetical protein